MSAGNKGQFNHHPTEDNLVARPPSLTRYKRPPSTAAGRRLTEHAVDDTIYLPRPRQRSAIMPGKRESAPPGTRTQNPLIKSQML